MNKLAENLLGVEPLDLEDLVRRHGDRVPELIPLRERFVGKDSLLALAQRTLDAVRETVPSPPAPAAAGPRPWWTPFPSLYAAALLMHAGLGALVSGRTPGGDTLPPHARESAKMARAFLRRLGLPFTVREHAVALVLNYRKAENLVGSGAVPEAYMRLACALDLWSLYWLRKAELSVCPQRAFQRHAERIESFGRRAEEAGVLTGPPDPGADAAELGALGFGTPRQAHRAANAMRYFRLRADVADPVWLRERLREEALHPQGRLNLLIGPAGCGKSTWAAEHLADATIVSSDRMRAELTGDPADQSQNYLVFQRCVDKVRALLREGETVSFDATNYMEALREAPVQAARWTGAEIHTYMVDTGLQTALRRNLGRSRLVPEPVIQRHYRLLTCPALYESDQHWVVRQDDETQLYWPVAPPGAGAEPA